MDGDTPMEGAPLPVQHIKLAIAPGYKYVAPLHPCLPTKRSDEWQFSEPDTLTTLYDV